MGTLSYWMSRVGSSIPRGFSRRYILDLLTVTEHSLTGKEIIDKAIVQSQGKWRPSPGLIYPMLGRLLDEGLIIESDNGRYKITQKGLDMATDLQSVNNIFEKQVDVMSRIGNVGKFMAMDLIDRLSTIGSTLSSNFDKMTEDEKKKYKQFLQNEMRKLDEQESTTTSSSGQSIE
ncbi:MAG: PadR family transcriptional regulator [Nitrososphaeraceae archaeon]|jgi:DNA-binding PadR family transcriptional regulator